MEAAGGGLKDYEKVVKLTRHLAQLNKTSSATQAYHATNNRNLQSLKTRKQRA